MVDTPPANGTLSTFNGTDVVYTPNPGYTGPDSFVFHAAGPSVSSTQRTVNITVTGSAPLLTVARVGTGGGFVYSELPTSGIQCGSDCTEAYAPGQLVTLFPQADPGSTFIGWSGDCTGTGQCSVTMSAARNVTATFDLTPFDLAVSKAGAGTGSVFSSPGGIACGATCTAGFAPGTPVTLTHAADAGSQFTGWAGACTGTGGCNIAMDASKAVTATFTPVFTLDVAKAGAGSGTVASLPAGISCGSTCSAEFLTGTMVQLTATASAGSAFTGWSGACTGTGTCEVTLDQARSVTATFTPVFTLAVGKSGPGTGTITSLPAGISCGATCSAEFLAPTVVELFVAPGPGAAFTGWSGACTGTGACQVTMDQARSVTATFAQSHVLTVSKNGTGAGTISSAPVGIGCGSTCAFAFPAGTVVTLGKFPAAGSVFAGSE